MYSCYDPLLTIEGSPIPFVGADDVPIFKYLGRKVQFDFRDNIICKQISELLQAWLRKVDCSLLSGPQKSWIANHLICCKLAWSLMIHEFSDSQANNWTLPVQRFIRKWLGLARSATASVLYRSSEHFGLQFKHIGLNQRQLQVVKWHLMKHSRDPTTRAIYQRRLALDQEGHVARKPGQARTHH